MDEQETLPEISTKLSRGVIFISLIIIVLLFVAWYMFAHLPTEGQKKYGEPAESQSTSTRKVLEFSPYHDQFHIVPTNTKETSPEKEYVEIEAARSNQRTVDIASWTLENSKGKGVELGGGAITPLLGEVNNAWSLPIQTDSRLIVSTGRPPTGISFRVNKCSGYLAQFRDFTPPLTKACPGTRFEKTFSLLDQSCQTLVQNLPQCETITRAFPENTTGDCETFLEETVGYNGCVASHKNDPDFYTNEWRIFLKQDAELWSESHDTIILRDSEGKVITVFSY